MDTDIALCVDPYALSLEVDPWFIECNDLVVDYFQNVLDSIRTGDINRSRYLLLKLSEPNDIRLGFSQSRPAGCGIGPDQARDVFNSLRKSEAVKTGRLQDLSDCELLIPGIASDKISDITVNIIRGKLVEYTEQQCALHGIRTQRIASGLYWDSTSGKWANRYAYLPIYRNERIVLVPKAAVRYDIAVDHQKYYQHFVLEYLQAEHLAAGSSLVTVLKNGKKRVTKKDLEATFKPTKENLSKFSDAHPQVLAHYKDSLDKLPQPINDEQIERKQLEPRDVSVQNKIGSLEAIPAGTQHANDFHNFILGALETLFYPNIRSPAKEQAVDEGRKRIDIVFNNGAVSGFFSDLNILHRIRCPYIFVECKNYSTDPKNPELDQLIGRFHDNRGRFGILVCRTVVDKPLMQMRCKDIAGSGSGYVLVLDDDDIKELLKLRAVKDFQGLK